MSLVQVRVELPAYAHSFVVQVASTSTIGDVKQEIFSSCVGNPRVTGQRIIWRGRYLVDHEKLDDLWKSPDEPRIVHLAVHPSAWSSAPPEIPPPAQAPTPLTEMDLPQDPPPAPPPPTRTRRAADTAAAPSVQFPHPLAFILHKHHSALSALSSDTASPATIIDQDIVRAVAVQAVEKHGWIWPAILDEEFPTATEGGLRYERVSVDGQNFLSLVTPSAVPTPLQLHAFQVLSYTFTLLSIPISHTVTTRPATPQSVPIPPNVNLLLQQLGLPQLRVAPNQLPNQNQIVPGLRDFPLRPLLAPMLFLVFRTVLLLYFVAPARKPIFGILILAWMLFEIWRPIRNVLIRGLRAAAAAENEQNQPVPGGADQPVQGAPNPQPNAHAEAPRPPQNVPGGAQAPIFDLQGGAVLDAVANLNISTEEAIFNEAPGSDMAEPSLWNKLVVFFGLLVTTLHPAIWNARRVALRQREGRIRTEANIRDAPVDNEGEDAASANRTQLRNGLREQYNRRPRWIREYMDRVVAAEWVDDSD